MAEKELSFKLSIEGVSNEAAELAKLELQLRNLKKGKDELQKQANKGIASNDDLLKLAAYNKEIKSHTDTIKTLKRVIDTANDSLDRKKALLIELTQKSNAASDSVAKSMAPAIKKLNDEIKAGEQARGVFTRNVGNYASAFKNAAASVMHFLGVSAGIAGVIEIGKKAIESTEGATDKFEQTMAALDGATQGFFRTIVTGDWSNFIKNMKDAAAAAKDLKAAQQELEHIATGNKIAIDELTLKLNELKNAAAEETDSGEKSKILNQAIEVQRQITSIKVSEAEKRAGIDEEYYRKQANRDETYWKQFMQRIPEISKNYEMQFALLDGYKKRLEQLNYLQLAQKDGLTKAQQEEQHYYQLLVYNLEDFEQLQENVGKAGKWDAFLQELSQVTLAAAEGEAALRRMLSQRTRADVKSSSSGKAGDNGEAFDERRRKERERQGVDEMERLEKEYKAEQEALADFYKETDKANQENAERKRKTFEEYQKKERDETEKHEKNILAIKQSALQGAQAGADAVFASKKARLQAEMEAELSNANLTEQQKTAIRKKFGKEQQRMDVTQAIINGALAVGNALATAKPFFPMAIIGSALAAVQAGIQVATIKAQKYATGGLIKGGLQIHPDTSKDNTLIYVKQGEAVLNQRQIAFLGGSGAMRAARVPGFAEGGYVGQQAPYIPPSYNAELRSDIQGLGDRIQRIEVFLPTHKIIEAVKEVQVITTPQRI